MLHHFILTRFNIRLFSYDKHGHSIERQQWFEERLKLFEQYTLPSVMGQTCQDFTWVLLVSSTTPVEYRERLMGYRQQCPQITFIPVKEQYGWQFAKVFQMVVAKQLKEKGAEEGDYCLTTYFDNDDCLHKDFVKDTRELLMQHSIKENGFLVFDYGIQYYTDMGTAARIKYTNNHFLTLCERITSADSPSVRTCYGYGSHIDIEKRNAAPVHHVTRTDKPMWIEVIHKDNVDNDVKMTFDITLIKDKNLLQREFSVNTILQTGKKTEFIIRYLKQILRHLHNRLFPRKW